MYESLVTRVLRGVLDASPKPLRVIEIGTAYGEHLYQLRGCTNLAEMVSIDTMYDWVPDVGPDEAFDPGRVDKAKVDRWNENNVGISASLIISKSHDAASGSLLSGTFDVIVIDGCHHPTSAVESDYWDFVRYMAEDHIVIFDDINQGDPGVASSKIIEDLKQQGMAVSHEDVEGDRVRMVRVSLQPPTPTQ